VDFSLYFGAALIGVVVLVAVVLYSLIRASDRRCREQLQEATARLFRELGHIKEALAYAAPTPGGPNVRSRLPTRSEILAARPLWLQEQEEQARSRTPALPGGKPEELARAPEVPSAMVPGIPTSPPTIRQKTREELLRERYEALCNEARESHCEELSCLQGTRGQCRCPCDRCVKATALFRQAVEELGPTSPPDG
jgi:hypothetical protein